jgi:hypothetical protein
VGPGASVDRVDSGGRAAWGRDRVTGSKSARIWRDAVEAAVDPNRVEIEERTLTSVGNLAVRFAPDGGFVAPLTPVGR